MKLFEKIKNFKNKKNMYLLVLVIIILLGFIIVPTYAKFASNFVTEEDIVQMSLSFDIGISSIEEYHEIIIPTMSSYKFNVQVKNSGDTSVYYGVWYKMVSPSALPGDGSIEIGKLSDTSVNANGEIASDESKTVTIGINNYTSNNLVIYIGVASSETSTSDIEYLNGRTLITGEVDVEEIGNFKLSDYVINQYNDSSTKTAVNIGGDTANPKVYLNTNKGIMLDNNGDYRYYGAEPNNYVWYNDELWRIISVGNVKSSATDTVGETRVKIVKADVLTDDNGLNKYSWDSSDSTINSGKGVNDWSKADLMKELNSLYFNSASGTCYTGASNATTACSFTNTGLNQKAKSLTGDALYYLGGSSSYGNVYADDFYTFERGTTVYNCSVNDGACPRTTKWTGRVGIIYPSDYLYATDLSLCTKKGNEYNDTNCYGNDWLLYEGDDQITISPYSSIEYVVFYISSNGYISNSYGSYESNAYIARAVRPVQYLKADVVVTGGDGTSNSPYTIDIETAADYIINKYNDGSTITTVNIGGSTDNPEVHLNATQGIMLDNNGEYRYYGADPNNYVWYNDELWRIISVGNVKSSATDTIGETRLKIVKADILTDDNGLNKYSWDSSASTINSGYGVNDWTQADLKTELNTLYFNSTSGNCYTGASNATTACKFTNTGLSEKARNLTGDALYYLGGASEYTGLYADDYYNFERGTDVYPSTSGNTCSDGACPRATTWVGRVGIIYPSDYVYAVDLSLCTQPGISYNDTSCSEKNWLLPSAFVSTISPHSTASNAMFGISPDGWIRNYQMTIRSAMNVLPVQYLKSNIEIYDGTGTRTDPYIIVKGDFVTVPFNVNEDFTDATYDSNIIVTTDNWGVSSGRFASNADYNSATITFTPTANATLSFSWGSESEDGKDVFTVFLNGNELVNAGDGMSGNVTNISLTAGVTYTFTLSYENNSYVSGDMAYIDNLIIKSN